MSERPKKEIIITVRSGEEAARTYRFLQDTVSVGRSPFNDIVLASDSAVSANHATFIYTQDEWHVEDRRSKNGTFIERPDGSQPVNREKTLRPGEVVVLGRTTLNVDFSPSKSRVDSAARFGKVEFAAKLRNKCGEADNGGPEHITESSGPPARPAPESADRLTLRIDLVGDELKYHLSSPHPVATSHRLPYRRAEIKELHTRMQAAVHRNRAADEAPNTGHRGEGANVLREVGAYISEHLLPRRIRAKLHDALSRNLFLVHNASLIDIPWELARIDDECLCCKFSMGRQVTVERPGSVVEPSREAARPRILIVADPTNDFPERQADIEELLDFFRKQVSCTVDYLAGPRVKRLDLLARLSKADVTYFFGHAEHDDDDPGNSGWLLSDGRITARDFRRMSAPPSLVFANGCETSREADWPSRSGAGGTRYGLAGSFMLSGVDAYIGTLWPVNAEVSAAFAGDFFAALVDGHDVGEAVRRARRRGIERFGEQELVWAAYVLFGDPSRYYLLLDKESQS